VEHSLSRYTSSLSRYTRWLGQRTLSRLEYSQLLGYLVDIVRDSRNHYATCAGKMLSLPGCSLFRRTACFVLSQTACSDDKHWLILPVCLPGKPSELPDLFWDCTWQLAYDNQEYALYLAEMWHFYILTKSADMKPADNPVWRAINSGQRFIGEITLTQSPQEGGFQA
jgi:hypothetical protein